MELSGQSHALAALSPEESVPSTLEIEGFVDAITGLYALE